jgi:hypothetical protein
MNFDSLLDKLFWIVFALVAGTFVWRMFRHGGLRGAMFGASVARTVGEVKGVNAHLHSMTVKVHTLSALSDKAVGVELVAKSFASYQMTPVTLSREAALQLADLLRTAAGASSVHG